MASVIGSRRQGYPWPLPPHRHPADKRRELDDAAAPGCVALRFHWQRGVWRFALGVAPSLGPPVERAA